jgi:Carboxypeptidase regulatory-like domain
MRTAVLLFLIVLGASTRASAQTIDVIRGRITGPDSLPIVNATVRATTNLGNVSKSARTDRNGRYAITFPSGEGDYWIDVSALGFAPRRQQLKRVADEEILILDMRLSSTITTLDQVNIAANRPRALPGRNSTTPDVGGGERPLTALNLPPDQMGNLAALAAGIPGLQLIPGFDGAADAFSALGLSPEQNSTTVNGLGSSINALPPDAQVQASVLTYSYDPAIGDFSGARVTLNTLPGSNISSRQASLTGVTPQLQFADRAALAQNQPFTNGVAGVGGRGALVLNRHFYNGSLSLTRNVREVPSLLSAGPDGLLAAGVSPDSVSRFLSVLQRAGVPASLAGSGDQQLTDRLALQGNLDLTPGRSGTGNAITLSYLGNYTRSAQVGGGRAALLSVPAHNGTATRGAMTNGVRHTNYFWFGVLSNTVAGISATSESTTPYLRVPNGSVRINSVLTDGSSAIRPLRFGGNAALARASDTRVAEIANELRWFSANNRHALKLTTGARAESFETQQPANRDGTFTYNSLGDLERGLPVSYSRTLTVPRQDGRQVTWSTSLGDYYRPTPDLQVLYGVRVDGNRLLTAPQQNPTVTAATGLRNDVIPNGVYVSPRVGLTWRYGTQSLIGFVPGAARPPRALVQGGFGAFQSLRPAELIASAVTETGLPGSTLELTCVGEAAPVPDWSRYRTDPTAIPSQCADGTEATTFANRAPTVRLFGEDYRQSRAWRGNLNWSGPIFDGRYALGVSAVYSWNEHQPDEVDRNLVRAPAFALGDEGNRPVFVSPMAIDPRTGGIGLPASRRDGRLMQVWEARSDLRSDARQVQVALRPVTANPYLRWTGAYQWLALRDEYRGFSSTSGDPFSREWSRSLQAGRHRVTLAFSDFPIFDVAYLSWQWVWQSGVPYTPTVGGDINGDGIATNDRAHVPDPRHGGDAALSQEMAALLQAAPGSARRCLERNAGRVATRASCQGPWFSQLDLNVRFNPQKIGLPKRASVNFSVNNPLGMLDLLLHGDNLRGWGQFVPPDPQLLFVRGFDPALRRYQYEVNRRFGATNPTQTATRALPMLNLRVQLDIGTSRERQVLMSNLRTGRDRPGTRAEPSLLRALALTSIPNPMALILVQSDSLGLSRLQRDSLAAMSRAFTQHADAVWAPVLRELDALPDRFSHDAVYARYVDARERTVDYLLTHVPSVKRLLTATQRRRLPLQLSNYLDERVLRFLRSSSSGDGSPVFIR